MVNVFIRLSAASVYFQIVDMFFDNNGMIII